MLQQAQTYFKDSPELSAPGGPWGRSAGEYGGGRGAAAAAAAAALRARLRSSPIVCVRADIARLPFATGSVDAIHAGAAIHCWPNPQAALAEISRVLRPGGVFVASTFLTPFAPIGELLGDDTVRPISQALERTPWARGRAATYRQWEQAELRELAGQVGLAWRGCVRANRFILFAADKPWLGGSGGGRPGPPSSLVKALNPFSGANGTIRYWDEGELVDLVNSVGLEGYARDRARMFVMFAATKPGGGR
ncbi:putative methyltransferase [Monoraphidium neglectum]|uniref:Putative methyltransferase n=1 Tax=Monoraphidium neglectum TaxID=145388 RepID=A0A0D2M4I9_9CHLO|nr:putative methyltransferase [Monoraphidium neglectum]KIY98469.1 putative methyltransferase [Monoraphidium neglectum]|eukprot:XP_013897489.1 putative methyltransferase [Monoraphidium neglectum]